MYKQKIEGEFCGDCGKAKYVKSPKSGKIFCADKCWLRDSQEPAPVGRDENEIKFEKSLDNPSVEQEFDKKKQEEVIGMIRTNLTGQWLASGRDLDAKAFTQIDLGVRYAYQGMEVVPALLKEPVAAPAKPAQPNTPPFIEKIKADPKYQDPQQPTLTEQHAKGKDVWDSLVDTQ